MKIRVYKRGGAAWPLRTEDKEVFSRVNQGTVLDGDIARQSQRSLQNHRLYFKGLLGLAMDYWEPTGGTVSPSEENILNLFSKRLEKIAGNTGAVTKAKDQFLADLKCHRANKYEAPNKSINDLHVWVKIEAGYYDLIASPEGMIKVAKSINFNAMSNQRDFDKFYKAAFDVVSKFILSRTFENEAEAQAAINQLLAMG